VTVDMGAYEYGSSRFRILGIAQAGAAFEVTWKSHPGYNYTVWSCLDLLTGEWIEEATIPSQGVLTIWIDSDTASSRKFYKIGIE